MNMYISDEFVMAQKVLIFLHIPKAAGSTLDRIIDRQFPRDAIFTLELKDGVDLVNRIKNLSQEEKQRIRCLRGHLGFGLHQWLPKPPVYITLLREPVDRLISEYYYRIYQYTLQFHQSNPFNKLLSEDTLKSLDSYAKICIEWGLGNLQTRMISGFVRMGEESPPYKPLPEEALQVAKDNLSGFGVFGLTERFDESLLLMREAFGWRNIFYNRQNVTPKRLSKSEIPKETIKLIEDSNQLDMELYEFAKQEFEEKVRERGEHFKRELRNFQMLNKAFVLTWNRLLPKKVKGFIRNIKA